MKRITFLSIFFCYFFIFSSHSIGQKPSNNFELDSKKLVNALQIIDLFYVDTVNNNKLVEVAIVNMLKELDPHSVFLTKEEMKEANEPLQGNFDGIGIQFSIIKDTIIVVTPTAGGPSEKLGIQSGDKIIKIDGEDATGSKINNDYVLKHLRGVKGTIVSITIKRKGKKDFLDYRITRDKIPINSIDATFMSSEDIGYIKLNRFGATTMSEFKESVSKLKKSGMKNLILDLRGNGGGYLNTAIELADEFLGKEKLVVYTEGQNSPKQKYNATFLGGFEKGKLIVLVDENSASASEIVAGAVQDWDRGLIIGRRTFGKGLVQRPFNLPDGSVIRLTSARYFTPAGRSIQKPYTEGTEQYYKDLYNRYKNGETFHSDSIHFPDSLKYYTSKKRLVYGGGGIMPDIFIPADTSKISDYYIDLLRKGLIYSYSIQYINQQRDSLLALYPSIETYKKSFNLDSVFLNKFLAYTEAEGVKKVEEGYELSKEFIINQIRSYIARSLYDNNSFYEIYNETDDVYLQALKYMNDKTFKKYQID